MSDIHEAVKQDLLRQIFRKHSDCYTTFEKKGTDEIGTEQAMTEEMFLKTLEVVKRAELQSQSILDAKSKREILEYTDGLFKSYGTWIKRDDNQREEQFFTSAQFRATIETLVEKFSWQSIPDEQVCPNCGFGWIPEEIHEKDQDRFQE